MALWIFVLFSVSRHHSRSYLNIDITKPQPGYVSLASSLLPLSFSRFRPSPNLAFPAQSQLGGCSSAGQATPQCSVVWQPAAFRPYFKEGWIPKHLPPQPPARRRGGQQRWLPLRGKTWEHLVEVSPGGHLWNHTPHPLRGLDSLAFREIGGGLCSCVSSLFLE